MLTQNGKLLYISDNAAEYLGHSMVSQWTRATYFIIIIIIYAIMKAITITHVTRTHMRFTKRKKKQILMWTDEQRVECMKKKKKKKKGK